MRALLIALAAVMATAAAAPAQTGGGAAPGEAAAWAAVHRLLPRNTAMDKVGGEWMVTPPNKAQRPATAAEAKAIASLEAAILRQRAADRAALRAAMTADERAAIDAADAAVRAALPADAAHRRAADGVILVAGGDGGVRAPTANEQPALERFYALADEIEQRLLRKDIETAPMRILAAQAPSPMVVRPGQMMWRQPLVFNRAAQLESDMVVKRGRASTVIAAGAILFVYPAPDGRDGYCLPPQGDGDKKPAAWTPCFFDSDGDGLLDQQTDGGAPTASVYVRVNGFKRVGAVTVPARARSIPYMQGYRQYVGPVWAYTATDKRSGAATAYFTLNVAAPDGDSRGAPIAGATYAAPLDADGRGAVEILGARLRVEQKGADTLSVQLVRALPEQPFGRAPAAPGVSYSAR